MTATARPSSDIEQAGTAMLAAMREHRARHGQWPQRIEINEAMTGHFTRAAINSAFSVLKRGWWIVADRAENWRPVGELSVRIRSARDDATEAPLERP